MATTGLVVVIALIAGAIADDTSIPVTTTTQYGPVEGFVHTASEGTVANVFLGIPFAKPPVDDLRFERPLPPDSWTTTLETKNFRNSCIPYSYGSIQNEPFSEDCLYLNIIAPATPSSDSEGYPVLVYIHGGGFDYGDVVKCGYDKVTKNLAKRGLVTVTVPYRVGLYGFMSLGTNEDPGNVGMWDMTAALTFIKNNIQNFGGDSNNIAIWGQSAGSAAVDLLSLSPHSRNLFQKVIQSSGCGTNEWASSMPVTKVTKALAAAMGCTSTVPTEIKAFLKAQSWQDIMNVSSNAFSTDIIGGKAQSNYLLFAPRYDNDFFDGKTVEELIAEAPPKPLLAGLMTLEAGTFIWLAGRPASELATYGADNFTATIKSSYAPQLRVGPEYKQIQNDIINQFVHRGTPAHPTSDFYIKRHAELLSDLMFNQEVLDKADMKVKRGWPVYFYLWDHMSAPVQATLPAAKGAWHTSEIYYVFDQLVYANDVLGPQELKVANYFCDIFAQFAYTGNPRTVENRFPRYLPLTKLALWIDPTLSINSNFIWERRLFWKIHTSKFNFNILRGRTRQQIINGSPLDNGIW